jgi:acyl CoA:acetate/3-ketoacid CoA transferase beta subunit
MDFTPDELMVVCMSRQVQDDEVVVQGIATPLVAAAYMLARKIHAPKLYFASAIGQGICRNPVRLSINQVESLWLDQALSNIGFVRTTCDILPSLKPKEFFRPAQVDQNGNFNNIAFGHSHLAPKLRLPGTGGIPDVTTFSEEVYLYVPRHSKVTFVPELDFLSGLGHHPGRIHGKGPRYLVSDLGEFDFFNGHMRLTSIHPGVDIKKIIKKTGFDLVIPSKLIGTKPPTREELTLLREEIDPFGIRRLENLSGASRRKLLSDILAQDKINH